MRRNDTTEGPFATGYGSPFWCNVGITFARAKALHLHNVVI